MADIEDSTKRCRRCKEYKPRSAFTKDRQRKDRLSRLCRKCSSVGYYANVERISARSKKYREANAEKIKAWQKAYRIAHIDKRKASERVSQMKYLYGITPRQYATILLAQDNSCAICREPFNDSKPQIDHDHATEEVRGLLCRRCNVSLAAYERPGFLDAAAKYLADHATDTPFPNPT